MKVLVAEKIADSGIEMLKSEFDVDVKTGSDARSELVAEIPAYDALIVRSATKATREVIEAGENLKIIGRAGVGVDNVDVDAATERGIIVCNAPTSNIVSAAEQTMALMLAQRAQHPRRPTRRMHAGQVGALQVHRHRALREDARDRRPRPHRLARGRARARLRHEAHRLRPLHRPRSAPRTWASSSYETIDELLPLADFITVHLPKTKETIGMFGAEQFAKMKDGVRLVNTARGGIYQIDALADALKQRQGRRAGIDVFEVEPCTDSPLIEFDNVIAHAAPRRLAPRRRRTAPASRSPSSSCRAATARWSRPPSTSRRSRRRSWRRSARTSTLAEDLGTHARAARARRRRGARHAHDRRAWPTTTRASSRPPCSRACSARRQRRGASTSSTPTTTPSSAASRSPRPSAPRRTTTSRCSSFAPTTPTGPVEIGAALIGKKNEPRIVSLFGYDLDMAPGDNMAFFLYRDRPGVIGKVGTDPRRGQGINIAIDAGRPHGGRRPALMGIVVDSPLSEDALEAHQPGAPTWTTPGASSCEMAGIVPRTRLRRRALRRRPVVPLRARGRSSQRSDGHESATGSTSSTRRCATASSRRARRMNTEEKLEIARQLVRLGVDVIEAGFPISSPGDFESVRRIGAEVGDAAVVCGAVARGPQGHRGRPPTRSRRAARPRIHTGIGVSREHLRDKLRITERRGARARRRRRQARAHLRRGRRVLRRGRRPRRAGRSSTA